MNLYPNKGSKNPTSDVAFNKLTVKTSNLTLIQSKMRNRVIKIQLPPEFLQNKTKSWKLNGKIKFK
jgi:hypothetical protein